MCQENMKATLDGRFGAVKSVKAKCHVGLYPSLTHWRLAAAHRCGFRRALNSQPCKCMWEHREQREHGAKSLSRLVIYVPTGCSRCGNTGNTLSREVQDVAGIRKNRPVLRFADPLRGVSACRSASAHHVPVCVDTTAWSRCPGRQGVRLRSCHHHGSDRA